jgi:hypothetical protein
MTLAQVPWFFPGVLFFPRFSPTHKPVTRLPTTNSELAQGLRS